MRYVGPGASLQDLSVLWVIPFDLIYQKLKMETS